MAGDYIKREDAINEICLRGCALERQQKFVLSMCEAKQFAVDVIDDIPASDVRENVRGEWVYYWGIFKFSNCDGQMVRNVYPFCPWCGADMRGESDERLY